MSMGKKSNNEPKKKGMALSDGTLATVAGGSIKGEFVDGKLHYYYVDGPDSGAATITDAEKMRAGVPD